MGYYKGALHVDSPVKGVRTNLLFLDSGNEFPTFFSVSPSFFDEKETESAYPGSDLFMPGSGPVNKKWADYLRRR